MDVSRVIITFIAGGPWSFCIVDAMPSSDSDTTFKMNIIFSQLLYDSYAATAEMLLQERMEYGHVCHSSQDLLHLVYKKLTNKCDKGTCTTKKLSLSFKVVL